jgi:hypothetical protein
VSLSGQFESSGVPRQAIVRSLRSFNGYAPEFRAESDRLAANPDPAKPRT